MNTALMIVGRKITLDMRILQDLMWLSMRSVQFGPISRPTSKTEDILV
jgi:hypothetical protein